MTRKRIGLEQLDNFEVDETGQLFWNGKAVVLEQRLVLRSWELLIASVAASGAILAGLHPFLKSFGWIN
jgi:hypothetical protein